MRIKDSLIWLCAVLSITLLALLNYRFFLATQEEPTQLPAQTETGKPLFIHPKNAECAKVVGTDTSEVQVYLCHTTDDEYYYVRTMPATIGEHPFLQKPNADD